MKNEMNELYRLLNMVREGCKNTDCKSCLFYKDVKTSCVLQAALKCATPLEWIDPTEYKAAENINKNLMADLIKIRNICRQLNTCRTCPYVRGDGDCPYTEIFGSMPATWNLEEPKKD